MKSFDIGICPVFNDYYKLQNPFVRIRNSNRANSLLFHGIPSVMSPVPQALHDLKHYEHIIFAVSEQAWYKGLEDLIINVELRNKIGHKGYNLVCDKFSEAASTKNFIEIFNTEIKYKTPKKFNLFRK